MYKILKYEIQRTSLRPPVAYLLILTTGSSSAVLLCMSVLQLCNCILSLFVYLFFYDGLKLASCKSVLNPMVIYSTDRSKAVVPVLVLLFVALWFVLRGGLFCGF